MLAMLDYPGVWSFLYVFRAKLAERAFLCFFFAAGKATNMQTQNEHFDDKITKICLETLGVAPNRSLFWRDSRYLQLRSSLPAVRTS